MADHPVAVASTTDSVISGDGLKFRLSRLAEYSPWSAKKASSAWPKFLSATFMAAKFARAFTLLNLGMAIAAKSPTMIIAISTSTNVNARR